MAHCCLATASVLLYCCPLPCDHVHPPDLHTLQKGTVDDTFTPDQLWQLALTMLASAKPTAERDHSIAVWMAMTIGRGDDARLVFLPDLLPPEIMRVIGECVCSLHLSDAIVLVWSLSWGSVPMFFCSMCPVPSCFV